MLKFGVGGGGGGEEGVGGGEEGVAVHSVTAHIVHDIIQ